MTASSIEWTDETWNPVRGCKHVSEGCRHCFAEAMAARNLPEMRSPTTGKPFAVRTPAGPRWTGAVELIPSKLDEPLRWKKPRRVFVNSMSDLFHEALDFHDIAAVYGVMAHARQHTFQILTKRPARRLAFMRWMCELVGPDLPMAATFATDPVLGGEIAASQRGVKFGPFDPTKNPRPAWPLANVWEGTSVEDQATADERIPLLIETPAAVRFISLEPQLAHVDLATHLGLAPNHEDLRGLLHWVIQGGESGPGARPFDLAWARSVRDQCKAAGVRYFLKQVGSRPVGAWDPEHPTHRPALARRQDGSWLLADRKGGDMTEWPEDLRVRQFPGEAR